MEFLYDEISHVVSISSVVAIYWHYCVNVVYKFFFSIFCVCYFSHFLVCNSFSMQQLIGMRSYVRVWFLQQRIVQKEEEDDEEIEGNSPKKYFPFIRRKCSCLSRSWKEAINRNSSELDPILIKSTLRAFRLPSYRISILRSSRAHLVSLSRTFLIGFRITIKLY